MLGQGPRNPEHGELVVPDDWEFLPRGDAFVTRRVKAGGAYWLHRRLLGLWAPRATIEQAQALAEVTVAARGKRRVQSARQRDRREAAEREELVTAVRGWLDFTKYPSSLHRP